jgi:hypothetical protein
MIPKAVEVRADAGGSWCGSKDGFGRGRRNSATCFARGASFTSVPQLRKHIDEFIAAYNATAEPFAWIKAKVDQRVIAAIGRPWSRRRAPVKRPRPADGWPSG